MFKDYKIIAIDRDSGSKEIMELRYLYERKVSNQVAMLMYDERGERFVEAYFAPGMHPLKHPYTKPYKFLYVNESLIDMYIDLYKDNKRKNVLTLKS